MKNESVCFGECLKNIIELGDIKQLALSAALNYDVSYISKWIHGVKLPSKKNIEQLCSDIAEFLAENISTEKIPAVLEYLGQEQEDSDYSHLYFSVKTALQNCYFYQKMDIRIPAAPQKQQTKTFLFPQNVSKGILLELNKNNFQKITSFHFIVDLFNTDFQYTYLFLLTLLENHPNRQEIELKYALGFSTIEKNREHNIPLLLHVLTFSSGTEITFSREPIPLNLAVIKDTVAVNSQSLNSGECFLVNVFTGKEDLDRLYQFSSQYFDFHTTPTFASFQNTDFLLKNRYFNWLMHPGLRFLLASPNEFFLDEQTFRRLAREYFPESVEGKLLEIYQLLRHALYHAEASLLIQKDSLPVFAFSRELSFFNQKVVLTPEECHTYFSNMIEKLSSNPCVKSRYLSDDIVQRSTSLHPTTLFLADNSQLILPNMHSNNPFYYEVKSHRLRQELSCYYDQLWKESEEASVIPYLTSLRDSCAILCGE